MVRDASTGKYRRTRLFVLTLGYSRKSVRLLVWRSSAQVWAELHERAFRRLGGTVKVIVLDNLREGCARRSETRPVRRSESDPPEGRSFYARCSLRALPGPWPGGVIGRSSGRAPRLATDARGYPGPRRFRIR